MRRTIITPAELGGAALDELKQWLAITTDLQDAALTALLEASVESCEAFTRTMPLSVTGEEILPARRDWQSLSTQPVQAITGVDGIPAEGSRFALGSDAYEIELEADGSACVRVLQQGSAGRIAVRFVAGLAPGWGSLPEGLKHGIIRLAAARYRDRDSGQSASLPDSITALWRPWRRTRLT
ncbi:head-tail connector protein [Pontixanthobacter aquaemixtae]|uniref:Phage gp6-like head-tail connector protein n=1 Tax=Pontixanthobacter aquaemixtae TaxID=1958940 RepID=A0A844ZSB0_9SPHN|nr:hypothetical protein [Pontixanthobacter aquaemixtae]MXO91221.1 hypothetical protein [Pontixanthobacter aquaemixtae]